MNRASFGDTRDLFKYDLVRHVMKALPVFDRIAVIPMLSSAAKTKRGSGCQARDLELAKKKGRAGSQNSELLARMMHLQETDSDLDYFASVRDYFMEEKITFEVLGTPPFTHADRSRYFSSVLARFPQQSLVFLDPDTGIEEGRPSEKHVLFGEIEKIYAKMDKKSLLMIYQHIPRENRKKYMCRRCSELQDLTGCSPHTITDNEIVFFFMDKNPILRENLEDVLCRYANSYPALDSGGNDPE